MEELNRVLEEWNYVYDCLRPHRGLYHLTPMELLNSWMEECKEGMALFTMW